MNQASRIVFFVPERTALSGGIFDAQVLTPARVLNQWGMHCLILGTEHNADRAAEAERKIQSEYGLEASIIPRRLSGPGPVGLWRTARNAWTEAQGRIAEFAPTHLYTRSMIGVDVLVRSPSIPAAQLVFDYRGAVPEEVRFKGPIGYVYRELLRILERRAIRAAGRLTCVSENLKAYMKPIAGERAISVVPCCVDVDIMRFSPLARDSVRQLIGAATDDVVVAYAGGMSHWQRIDDISKLMVQLARYAPRFRFLILTNEPDRASEIFPGALQLDGRMHIAKVAHRKMGDYLSAADCGVLLRDETLMNKVASPVKAAEYVSCGLLTLLTSGVGDYSQTLPAQGLALRVEQTLDNVDQIAADLLARDYTEVREKAVQYAQEKLSWEGFRTTLMALYSLYDSADDEE